MSINNSGVQFFGGGTNDGGIHITTVTSDGKTPQPVDVKKTSKLPFTTGWIGTTAAALAIITFFTGWKGFSVVSSAESLAAGLTEPGWFEIPRVVPWIVASGVALALAIGAISVIGFLRQSVLKFPRWSALPAVVGARCSDGKTRPMFVTLGARCSVCGAKMRFFDMATEWIDRTTPQGRRSREVTARRPHAVCVRNPDHRAQIDVALHDFDQPIW